MGNDASSENVRDMKQRQLWAKLPHNTQPRGWTKTMHRAARDGDLPKLKKMLKCGAHVDTMDTYGQTSLLWAVRFRRLDCISLLLEHGGDANIRTTSDMLGGSSPLHSAACRGFYNCLLMLLDHGANLSERNNSGLTPLHLASSRGDVACVDLLLNRGAKVDCRTNDCWTPLHLASNHDRVDCVKLLLLHGAKVDAVTNQKKTALHFATSLGYVDVTEALIQHGADSNARGPLGKTPLHFACTSLHPDVVKSLFETHPSKSLEESISRPLRSIHSTMTDSILETILVYSTPRPDPHARTKAGETPLDLAKERNGCQQQAFRIQSYLRRIMRREAT